MNVKTTKTLVMEKWVNLGKCIARDAEGKAIFVPYVCPGEKVVVEILKRKGDYEQGRVREFLSTAADRIQPVCEHFGECGGCSFQHIDYAQEIRIKEQLLGEIFRRPVQITASPQMLGYRNKATFHCRYAQNRLFLGFLKSNSNEICLIQYCHLLPKAINELKQIMTEILSTIQGLEDIVFRVSKDQNAILVNILGDKAMKGMVVQKLDHAKAFILAYMGNQGIQECIFYYNSQHIILDWLSTQPYLTATIHSKTYHIGANDFFQTNYGIAELIFQTMRTIIPPSDYLLDAYCGSLVLGIQLSDHAQHIIGLEISQDALARAKENLHHNQIQHAQLMNYDLSQALPAFHDLQGKSCILVIDPPREGIGKTVETLDHLGFQQIVYLACDPMTAKRDCQKLTHYAIQHIQGYDMFPRTYHVECLIVLKLSNA